MGIVNAQHCESDVYEKLDKELLGFIEGRSAESVRLTLCFSRCCLLAGDTQ